MDVPRGRIETSAPEPERLVALPAAWVGDLLECLPDGADAFADRLVGGILADVNAVLDEPGGCLPDEVAYAVSLAFAKRGLGVVAFERWDDALLFVWRSAPATGVGFRDFAARLAGRLVGELFGLRVRGVVLGVDGSALRILLGSPDTCQELRTMMLEDLSTEVVLARLSPAERA